MAIGYLQSEKKLNRRIKHHIQDGLEDNGFTYEDMAAKLGLKSRQAFFYKLDHMTFTAYELTLIFKFLKFGDDEILILMKGD